MILFDRAELIGQLKRADWRLQLLVEATAGWLETRGYDLKLTSIERSPEETKAIYEKAGKKAPASSVHDVRPCRGADGVPIRRPGEPQAVSYDKVGPECAKEISAKWKYPRGYSSVLWHSVSGAHAHIQVSFDEMGLAP